MHLVAGRIAALSLIVAAGCNSSSVDADFTGISLYTTFEADRPVSEIHVTGQLDDDSPAFQMGITPVSDEPAVDGLKTVLLVILLQADKVGERVRLHVEGRDANGALLGAADDVVYLQLGYFSTSSVSLSADILCGNGDLDEAEVCDDGNLLEMDGCSSTCTTEVDWVCIAAPSQCFVAARTALVDAQAAQCPGNGTPQTPFCTIADALDAPWAETVAVRAGTFDEELEISRDLELFAEAGTTLRALNSPALRITADKARVTGLGVMGISRVGGGIQIAGTGQVTLQNMSMGPSSTVGVSVSELALVRIENSRISMNAGGGLSLATDRGYIVQNVFITENGHSNSEFGGVRFDLSPTNSIFSNNTIADNEARIPDRAGVYCSADAPLLNTVIWGNGTVTASTAELCHMSFCDLGPTAVGLSLEDGNFSSDPAFETDYTLKSNSPCIDRGDPESIADERAPTFDFEGEVRPQGPSIDVGADEAG